MLKLSMKKYLPITILYAGAIVLKDSDPRMVRELLEKENYYSNVSEFGLLEEALRNNGYSKERIVKVENDVKRYLIKYGDSNIYESLVGLDYVSNALKKNIDASEKTKKNVNLSHIFQDFVAFFKASSETAFDVKRGGVMKHLVHTFNMYKKTVSDKIYGEINSKGGDRVIGSVEMDLNNLTKVEDIEIHSGFDYKVDLENIYKASFRLFKLGKVNDKYLYRNTNVTPYYSIVDYYLDSQLFSLYKSYESNSKLGGEDSSVRQRKMIFKREVDAFTSSDYAEGTFKLRLKFCDIVSQVMHKELSFTFLNNKFRDCKYLEDETDANKNNSKFLNSSGMNEHDLFMDLVNGFVSLGKLEDYCKEKGINFEHLDRDLFLSLNPIIKFDSLEEAIKYYPLTKETEKEARMAKITDSSLTLLNNNEAFFMASLNGKNYNLKTIKQALIDVINNKKKIEEDINKEYLFRQKLINIRKLASNWGVCYDTLMGLININDLWINSSCKEISCTVVNSSSGGSFIDNPGDFFSLDIADNCDMITAWFRLFLNPTDDDVGLLNVNEVDSLLYTLVEDDEDIERIKKDRNYIPKLKCPKESRKVFLDAYRKALLKVQLNIRIYETLSRMNNSIYRTFSDIDKGILKLIPLEINSLDDLESLETKHITTYVVSDEGNILNYDLVRGRANVPYLGIGDLNNVESKLSNYLLTKEERFNNKSFMRNLGTLYHELVMEFREDIDKCNKFIESMIEKARRINLNFNIKSVISQELRDFGNRMLIDPAFPKILCSKLTQLLSANDKLIEIRDGFVLEDNKPKILKEGKVRYYIHVQGYVVNPDSRNKGMFSYRELSNDLFENGNK